MPNFDTGHLFLTLLSPIKQGNTTVLNAKTGEEEVVSYEQNLRLLLATLPTAQQSPATENQGKDDDPTYLSPFTLSPRTHICRFMVLDDVVYNGRKQRNSLIAKLKKNNPMKPQPVDRLNSAYLMFTAEIDASFAPEDTLPQTLTPEQQDEVRDAYARELWETMPAEIYKIYENCLGFNPSSAEDCVKYMRRCQVETTMPFNDYWLKPPALKALPIKAMLGLILAPLVLAGLALLSWLCGFQQLPLGWLFGWTPGWTFLGSLAVGAGAAYGVYRYILSHGDKPLPAGKYADLPSVLKSLYIQRHFTDFAINMQGQSDEALFDNFKAFVGEHVPHDKMNPTQKPGIIPQPIDNSTSA